MASATAEEYFSTDLSLWCAGRLGLLPYTRISSSRVYSSQPFLPGGSSHDSVLCATVCDIDCDGRREIVLGGYGHEL